MFSKKRTQGCKTINKCFSSASSSHNNDPLFSNNKAFLFSFCCRTLESERDDNEQLTEHEKRVIRVEERCKAKAKKAFSSDRLLEDKSYLKDLVKGIGHRPDLDVDIVEEEVSDVAYEALHFLKGREQFWKQVRLGQSKH